MSIATPATAAASPELVIEFLLPLPGWPAAVFEGDYGYDGGSLSMAGRRVLAARSRAELERGVEAPVPGVGVLCLRLVTGERGAHDVVLTLDGEPTRRRDALRALPARSAWIHALLALAASFAGFVAGYLYLLRAAEEPGDWSLKMANHMAAWHLLLTFTLFPASVWGQRAGIRLVQFVSLVFFFIHAGIALANLGEQGDAIAFFNAVSGVFFLAAVLYGNRAHRDMDPVAALRAGRVR